ncbi:MAG: hypothetical protein IJ201_08925 [Solobacterium sp.]|nr:hypothetical protein [Solobacterium sp.]
MAKIKKLFLEDYLFKGRYTQMVVDLTETVDPASGAKIFDSAVELYLAAAIIGAHYQVKGKPDTGDPTKRIMANQFTNHYQDLVFAYKLVMLNADKEVLSPIERINNAFRYTEDDPQFQNNIEVFETYMLGGLELLHDRLYQANMHFEDYLNALDELLIDINDYHEEDDVKDIIDFGPAF